MTTQLQTLVRQWRTRSVEQMAEAMKHHPSHRGYWLGESEALDRAADQLERALATALGCVPEAHQSRICERGTSGCMVAHVETSAASEMVQAVDRLIAAVGQTMTLVHELAVQVAKRDEKGGKG
jgi:hypothetical protein